VCARVCEQELKELAALAYRDTTSENREFWKNEMGNALRDLQRIYDDKMDGIRDDMEMFYNMKVSDISYCG
jgi:intermediate filament protein if